MLGNLSNIDIKPLIILGAGASHDCVNPKFNNFFEGENKQYKPPLTDDLFKSIERNFLIKIQKENPKSNGIIARIQTLLDKKDKKNRRAMCLEEILEKIQKESNLNSNITNELNELKKVIHQEMNEISKKCEDIPSNNYDHFFRNMEDIKSKYLIVNFNYDSLAQRAITRIANKEIGFTDMDSYINQDIQLIHPHGSVLWEYQRQSGVERIVIDNKNYHDNVIKIPTISNKGFVHPPHLEALRNYLKTVNVIIIIGWKGNEEYFNNELALIEKPPKSIIIVGNSDKNKNVLKNAGLNKITFRSSVYYIKGFSNLLYEYPHFRDEPKEEHRI